MRRARGSAFWRGRPDLRWRSSPLPELQLEVAEELQPSRCKPGATIVYSVCTLNADENEVVVDASGLRVEPLGEGWPQFATIRSVRRVLADATPHRHHTSRFLHREAPNAVIRSPAMGWNEWIRTVEIVPSLTTADPAAVEGQVEALSRSGCRIFHIDVGDVDSSLARTRRLRSASLAAATVSVLGQLADTDDRAPQRGCRRCSSDRRGQRLGCDYERRRQRDRRHRHARWDRA